MSTSKVLGFVFCLASFTWVVPQGRAEIALGSLQNFNTLPTTNEWTTAARTGAAGDFIDAGALEADVQAIATAAAIRFPLPSDPGNPPGANAAARWSSVGLNVTTRPTGVGYTVLLAKIINNTDVDLPAVVISYDLSGIVSTPEDPGLEGHLVYYSVTGTANSWTPIPDVSGGVLGPKLATLDLGSWPPESHLYILWVDDNAVQISPDGAYTIDNFLVSTGVNPPQINVQPHSTNVVEGQTIALEVQSDGAGLTYSWQKVGGAIDPANPTINQAVLIITNAALSDAGDYFCVVANAAGSDTSANATVTVDQDLFPPKFVSAAEDPFDLTVVNVKVDEPLCQGAAITPNCTKESWQPFLWHVREKNNPAAELGVVGVTINGLDVALQTSGTRTIGVQYVVAVELGVADLHDNEMPEGTQIDVDFSGVGFEQNAGGYLGTQDTFITSDAPDTSQSTLPYLESDQVNPQGGVSQALLRFDNIFGDTPGQVPPGALILSATLVLNHTRGDADGTPVNLHRMLTDWDQNTATWNFFIDGIQPDDIEAAAVPELQIISPLPPFTLNLDVTESIRTWAEGAPNYGWVFLNTADNGYRPDSSDAADPPGLIIQYSTGQDTEGPVLRSVTASPNGTTMSLSFSEPLEPGSAQATAHYSLTPTVAVNAAVLSADGRTVTLTTAARAAGIYVVKVSNVTDNAPLRNVINPNPTSMVATQINVLFTYGTGTWKYETNSQDATLAVTPWYSPAFNDGSWQSGQAFFGFEQDAAVINILPPPKIVTPLPANSDANFPDASVTAYFRRLVTLPALPPRTAFQLAHYIDDGAVFYLNGVELSRYNMPTDVSPVVFTTRALVAGGEASLQSFDFNHASGNYLLAIEVHQGGMTSSDVVFGAELSVVPFGFALSITVQGPNAQIGWGPEAIGFTLESTPSLGGATPANWTAVAGAPNPLTAAGSVNSPLSSAPKFYRLRK